MTQPHDVSSAILPYFHYSVSLVDTSVWSLDLAPYDVLCLKNKGLPSGQAQSQPPCFMNLF
jgi:hypothetical protein